MDKCLVGFINEFLGFVPKPLDVGSIVRPCLVSSFRG